MVRTGGEHAAAERPHGAQREGACLARRQFLRRGVIGLTALGAACGGSRSVDRTAPLPPRLTILGPTHPVPAVAALIARQVQDAGRASGVDAVWEALPSDAVRSRLKEMLAARIPVDLAIVGDPDPALLAAAGSVVDVRDTLAEVVGLNGELFPPLRDTAMAGPFADLATPSLRRPVWAVPYASLGGAVLVRSDLLARHSIPLPRTFDELGAAAAALTGARGVGAPSLGWAAPLPRSDGVDDLGRVILLAHGAPLLDPLGIRVVLDQASASQGFQALQRLYALNAGGISSAPAGLNWTLSEQAQVFGNGGMAMTWDAGGLYGRLRTDYPGIADQVRALPIPAGPRGWFTAVPTTFIVVFRTSRLVDAARALITHWLRPEQYDAIVRAGRGAVIPPYADLTKTPFWDEDDNYPVFVVNARGDPSRQLAYAPPGYPAPLTPPAAMIAAALVIAETARAVASGEAAPLAAAATLAQRCADLARMSLSLQPTPSPTRSPFWPALLGPRPTPVGGA